MHCKTVAILLRIRVRGHFVMFITKNRESLKERKGILLKCLVVLRWSTKLIWGHCQLKLIINANQFKLQSFEERGKLEYPEKNLSAQVREPTNSTHI